MCRLFWLKYPEWGKGSHKYSSIVGGKFILIPTKQKNDNFFKSYITILILINSNFSSEVPYGPQKHTNSSVGCGLFSVPHRP